MSTGARIGVVLATVAVLALAFVLLSPEADDDSNTAQTPTTATPPPATTSETPAPTATTPPPPPPAPTFERVRVRGGQPVGGIKKITVQKGDRARFEVTSTDTSDEVHLHGYDITRNVAPGSRARFSFAANAEGIFEVELHGTHTQIAELTVEP
ncbi:MAG: hypothetical protein Q8K79_21400 [Solirubrobacteraceae bacterium]|nr:hypothetical protein [Solirubrobacteraceae bacterium]